MRNPQEKQGSRGGRKRKASKSFIKKGRNAYHKGQGNIAYSSKSQIPKKEAI